MPQKRLHVLSINILVSLPTPVLSLTCMYCLDFTNKLQDYTMIIMIMPSYLLFYVDFSYYNYFEMTC